MTGNNYRRVNPDEKAAQTIEALTPQPFERWQLTQEVQELVGQISEVAKNPSLADAEKATRINELLREETE